MSSNANMRSLTLAVFLDKSPRFFDGAAVTALVFIKMMECFRLHIAIELREWDNERKVQRRQILDQY